MVTETKSIPSGNATATYNYNTRTRNNYEIYLYRSSSYLQTEIKIVYRSQRDML
jgi:hypothetical protein